MRSLLPHLLLILTLLPSVADARRKRPAPSPDWSKAPRNVSLVIGLGYGHTAEAKPHWKMVQRVGRAVQAWRLQRPDGPDGKPWLLFTGGYTSGHVAEAEEMKIMATAMGVPAARILTDTWAGSTVHNAQNATQLMVDRGLTGAIVVSHAAHLPRVITRFGEAGAPGPIHPLHCDDFTHDALIWPEVGKLRRKRSPEMIVLLGESPNGSDRPPDLISVRSSDPDIAFTAAALRRGGFKKQRVYAWAPPYSAGHIRRTEVLGIAAIAWGVPRSRLRYGSARRFSKRKPEVLDDLHEMGVSSVLFVVPRGKLAESKRWLRRRRAHRRLQTMIVIEAFEAPTIQAPEATEQEPE